MIRLDDPNVSIYDKIIVMLTNALDANHREIPREDIRRMFEVRGLDIRIKDDEDRLCKSDVMVELHFDNKIYNFHFIRSFNNVSKSPINFKYISKFGIEYIVIIPDSFYCLDANSGNKLVKYIRNLVGIIYETVGIDDIINHLHRYIYTTMYVSSKGIECIYTTIPAIYITHYLRLTNIRNYVLRYRLTPNILIEFNPDKIIDADVDDLLCIGEAILKDNEYVKVEYTDTDDIEE